MRKYKLKDRWAHKVLDNGTTVWLDASGDVITEERVLRHMETIKMEIVSCWPKGYCKNTREEFKALLHNGVEEVYRCLQNFNKHECLNKVSANSKHKKMSDEERLQWKREHQAEALLDGERIWVRNALKRFFWRLRYDNSDEQLGGTEIAVDTTSMLDKCYRMEEDGEFASSFDFKRDSNIVPMRDLSFENPMLGIDIQQAQTDLEMLEDIAETEGQQAYLEHFKLLPQERQENLKEYCLNFSAQKAEKDASANPFAQLIDEQQEEEQEHDNADVEGEEA